MKINENNIFFFDGLGAMLSAIFTGLILPLFSDTIGLPLQVLCSLALLPVIFAVYSLTCYFLIKPTKSLFLKVIMGANLFYCVVSGIVIFTSASITGWGQVVLLGEIGIVLGVVAIERVLLPKYPIA